VSRDLLRLITQGDMLLMSKRLLLLSDSSDNKSLRWSMVLTVDGSGDRMTVQKARAKLPTQTLSEAESGVVEYAPLIARRLVRECS